MITHSLIIRTTAASKAFLMLLLFIHLTNPLQLAAQQYDSWSDVMKNNSGKLSVIYHPKQRLIYKEGDKMKGLCVGILEDFVLFIEDKYKKKVVIDYVERQTDFGNFLKRIEQTPFALGVANITITEERKRILKFTPPFLNMPAVLVTHQSAPTILNLSEIKLLHKYKAILVNGSSHAKALSNIKSNYLPGMTSTTGASSEAILSLINQNPQMFTVIDFIEFLNAYKNNPNLQLQQCKLGYLDKLGFIMNLNTDWDKVWNEFLTPQYKESNRYKSMIAENLGGSYLKLMQKEEIQ